MPLNMTIIITFYFFFSKFLGNKLVETFLAVISYAYLQLRLTILGCLFSKWHLNNNNKYHMTKQLIFRNGKCRKKL